MASGLRPDPALSSRGIINPRFRRGIQGGGYKIFYGGSAYKQFAPPSLDIILENITVGLRKFFKAIKQPAQSVVSYNIVDYGKQEVTSNR